jgi:hypothetical protein
VLSATAAGTCTVTATMAGNGNYNPVSSAVTTITFSGVSKIPTSITLSSSTSSRTYGDEDDVTFSAHVTSSSGTPTGTVSVMAGSTVLCTITLSGGAGSCTTGFATLPAGSYSITAVYNPTGNFAGSTSTSHPLTINKDTSTTTVSVSPTTVTYGNESVAVFTVTVVTGNGEMLPAAESVTVHVGSATCVALVTPSGHGGTGTCTISNTALPVGGRYAVSATYSGDTDLRSSSDTANTGLKVVAAISTHTSLALNSLTTTYGHESSIVFSVHVTGDSGTPTGTVTIISSAGTLCTVTLLNGRGTCSMTNTELPVGTYNDIVAVYNGTGGYASSSSSTPQTITVRA